MEILSDRNIQRLLDDVEEGGVVELPAGEFEGSFIISKSCTVRGKRTVLWSVSGPVLVVKEQNTALENLRAELTGSKLSPEQNISVYCCRNDTKFTDVEVNGAVIGIPDEEQYWGIPRILSLGTLPADRETSFSMEIYAPADAEISCGIYDVRLSQSQVFKGYNNISLTVGSLKSGSLLYGEILLKSAVTRKIIISGMIGSTDEPSPQNYLLYSADREAPDEYRNMLENFDPVLVSTTPEPEPEQVTPDVPVLEDINESEIPPDVQEENVFITEGMRIPLAPKKYRIELQYTSSKINLDIDGYLFMLGSHGRVEKDTDMIFFGNDHSGCGSVYYLNAPDKRAMVADFGEIPERIKRMTLLFSIYGESHLLTFDKLIGGEVSMLCENGVHMHLRLDPRLNSKTILALGFERTNGIWELIPSGKGVAMPLADICRSYGVTVV